VLAAAGTGAAAEAFAGAASGINSGGDEDEDDGGIATASTGTGEAIGTASPAAPPLDPPPISMDKPSPTPAPATLLAWTSPRGCSRVGVALRLWGPPALEGGGGECAGLWGTLPPPGTPRAETEDRSTRFIPSPRMEIARPIPLPLPLPPPLPVLELLPDDPSARPLGLGEFGLDNAGLRRRVMRSRRGEAACD